MKNNAFLELLNDMSKCCSCIALDDKSLVNFYNDLEFAIKIPSIWTDWFNHLDSRIFIIGQDWGPYGDMKELNRRFKSGENWQDLVNREKSLTKKNLDKFLSSINISLDEVFITNAIMCARCGTNYRGNDINLKYSTECCSKYLKRQVDIVKPRLL